MATKSILLCASLLGIAVLDASADGMPPKTPVQLPKEGCDKFVKDLNHKKREMVKRMNISDGYELTWDPELIKEISPSAVTYLSNKNITHYVGDSDSFDQLSQQYGILFTENGLESYENFHSLLCPSHRRIGCIGFLWDRPEVFIHCALAPGYSLSTWSQEGTLGFRGVPGSNCTDGYANNDGLCALIGSFTTEKPLTQPPGTTSSKAKDKDSVGVTDVSSGSSSSCILIGFLLFLVSFSLSF